MTRRRAALIPLLAAALLMAGGCYAAPAPDPTPTPLFSSEEEAFAAAEATYRAYVDAVNAQRSAVESADPTRYLIGDALEGELAGQEQLRQLGVHIKGMTELVKFVGERFSGTAVTGIACVDSSATVVLDAQENDVTPADRPPVSALHVSFEAANDALLIANSVPVEVSKCAS